MMQTVSRISSRYRLAALAAALAICGVSADAAATCWNNGCNGGDAVGSGCRDGTQFVAAKAAIKNSSGSVVGTVDLMYSGTCGSAWAYTHSAIGAVTEVDAFLFRNDGALEVNTCSNCSTKLSRMLGDAGSEKCQAEGVLRLKLPFFDKWLVWWAKTSWF